MEKLKFLLAIPLIGMMCLLFSFDYSRTNRQVEGHLFGSWEGTEEGGRSLHEGGTFILEKNKTYKIKDPSGKTNGQGTWSVQNSDILVTKYTNGPIFQYHILEITDNKLITKSNDVAKTPEGNAKVENILTYQKG